MAVFIGATKGRKSNRLKFKGDKIYHYDDYFEKEVWVGYLKNGIVKPTHGYFYPNPIGKKMKKWAENNGYRFDNK